MVCVSCHHPYSPFSRQLVHFVPANEHGCSSAHSERAPSTGLVTDQEKCHSVGPPHMPTYSHPPDAHLGAKLHGTGSNRLDARKYYRYFCVHNHNSKIHTFTHKEELSISTGLYFLRRILIITGRLHSVWERSLLCCCWVGAGVEVMPLICEWNSALFASI